MSWFNLLTLIVIASALALPGLFLVLRNMAMVSDAISHTVLLGIILGYLIVPDLQSPILILMAALVGVLTVLCIEFLVQKNFTSNDAATGIIFPFFFALAVILLSKYLRNVHIDLDCVIMGDITFADFNLVKIASIYLPISLVYGLGMLVICAIYITLFYKELKLSCFDPEAFIMAGFSATLINYSLTALVSLSAVVSFEIVGAILVVSFLVTPAATALLITKRLRQALIVTILFAIFNSVVGYMLSITLNVSTSGMCATIAGLSFVITMAVTKVKKRKAQRLDKNAA